MKRNVLKSNRMSFMIITLLTNNR